MVTSCVTMVTSNVTMVTSSVTMVTVSLSRTSRPGTGPTDLPASNGTLETTLRNKLSR